MTDKVPIKLKSGLCKTMVHPAILQGIETVAATRGSERKMEVAETRMSHFSLDKKAGKHKKGNHQRNIQC